MTKEDSKEKLIQAMMEVTGENRAFVEEFLDDLLQFLPTYKASCAESDDGVDEEDCRSEQPFEGEDDYPHYLPAEHVQKYTLRFSLRGVKPSIWRKAEVPSNISLRHLSELIISLMGWAGYHLNHFRVGTDTFYEPGYQRDGEFESMDFSRIRHLNQEAHTLAEILQDKGRSVVFEYDFGDGWEHDIRLSSVAEYAESEPHVVRFVGGKRACPPEDCGGIWGYEELCEIAAKKADGKRLTRDERERLEWYSQTNDNDFYNPEYLDLDDCISIAEDFTD